MAERAFRNLAGYGPLEPLLDDDDVWEVMVNAPDAIFVKRHRGRSGYHDEVFHDDEHVIRTLTKILDDATGSHRKLDPSEGLQDAQLDNGARLHIVHGDISRGGHVMVNIRKFTGVAFHHLDQLVERDMLSAAAAGFLAACVRARQTIVVAGAPGSGQDHAAVVLRGRARSRRSGSSSPRRCSRRTCRCRTSRACRRAPARPDRPAVDLRRLVAGFLRMAPDVAIVGEVRDKEALPLLLTLSSGVKGFTTIHAGSARQALTRLRFICQLSDSLERAAPGGAQHPREREHRRGRPLRAREAGPAGHRDRRRGGPRRGRRRRAVHRHVSVPPARARRPARVDGQRPRAARPERSRSTACRWRSCSPRRVVRDRPSRWRCGDRARSGPARRHGCLPRVHRRGARSARTSSAGRRPSTAASVAAA